jgi:hypothetical protein
VFYQTPPLLSCEYAVCGYHSKPSDNLTDPFSIPVAQGKAKEIKLAISELSMEGE